MVGRIFKGDCYTQNMKVLGLMVLEKILYVLPIESLCELMTPGV